MTLGAINAWNAKFWSKQSRLTRQRIADPIISALAISEIQSETIRLPSRYQKSLDQALADAERALDLVWNNPGEAERSRMRMLSRRGGYALKTDALQTLIIAYFQEEPEIDQRKLWHYLKSEQGLGVIKFIDDQKIEFVDRNSKLKTAPVSGLKDRLFRAKKK
jgi:hypothetical protein